MFKVSKYIPKKKRIQIQHGSEIQISIPTTSTLTNKPFVIVMKNIMTNRGNSSTISILLFYSRKSKSTIYLCPLTKIKYQ